MHFFNAPSSFMAVNEQISLLKNQNLLIPNESEARHHLILDNYHNIIDGYGRYFKETNGLYKAGANFSEILYLHIFDSMLRNIFLQAILSVESHVKSSLAYRFSEAFPNEPYPYLNSSNYDTSKILDTAHTIAQLSSIIKRERNRNGSDIADYIKQCGSVPLWVLSGYLSFGNLQHILSGSRTDMQNRIAMDMKYFLVDNLRYSGMFPPECMLSFIGNIHTVRNICAHNSRLFDFRCKQSNKYWKPLYGKYGLAKDLERRTLYAVYLSLQCFLHRTEYRLLTANLIAAMNVLQQGLHTVLANEIFAIAGFPADWNTKQLAML